VVPGEVKAMRRIFAAATLVAGLVSVPASAQDVPRPVTAVVEDCAAPGFRIIGDVVCLRALITPDIATQIENHQASISAIVLDTQGGDVAASHRIGRRLFRDKARIVVDGECSSSCANYFAPLGHRKLYVTEGSFIALHGVPPRDLWSFVDAQRIAAGKTVEELVANPNLFFEWQRLYPDHVRDVVIPDVQYFADVNVDEAYATRYAEVMRTISMRENYSCTLSGPSLLLIGPQWMRQFRINSQNVRWNANRREMIDALPASVKQQILVIDGDEHPSWIPGRGHVTPEDCGRPPREAVAGTAES